MSERAGPVELIEEALDRAAVRVAEPTRRDAEERADRDLEETAAGVAREAGEEVGRSMAVTAAPYPPLDLPATPRRPFVS